MAQFRVFVSGWLFALAFEGFCFLPAVSNFPCKQREFGFPSAGRPPRSAAEQINPNKYNRLNNRLMAAYWKNDQYLK
jgi:hypothetical protein